MVSAEFGDPAGDEMELPIGVITGLLGAPFLLVLVKRETLA